MDIRQLRYFCAIAEEGQISRAAQRLHIAQPPLSYQLKLLEEELGVKLIDRNTRSLSLTKAGLAFYQRAEQILGLMKVAAHRSQGRGIWRQWRVDHRQPSCHRKYLYSGKNKAFSSRVSACPLPVAGREYVSHSGIAECGHD